jgi:hypothetical protein
MLLGIGFISVAMTTIASKFIETDTKSAEVLEHCVGSRLT